MFAFIMIIHLLLAMALIGVVLVQRSEGGALGIGGGGGMMSGRAAANLLTRMTAYLAAGFLATSLVLAILSGGGSKPASILDAPPQGAPSDALPAAPMAPAEPSKPAVPLSQ